MRDVTLCSLPDCLATEHGTDNAYVNHRCRSPEAREAHRVERKRRELRLIEEGSQRVSTLGSMRRLQALAFMCYGVKILGAETGLSTRHVWQVRRGDFPVMLKTTHIAIADAFERLSAHVGPEPKAGLYARRIGWAPPLAWDDIDDPAEQPKGLRKPGRPENGHTTGPSVMDGVTDDLAIAAARAGHPVPLSNAERVEVIRHLAATFDDGEIALRLHMKKNTVGRLRIRHGIPSFLPCSRLAS